MAQETGESGCNPKNILQVRDVISIDEATLLDDIVKNMLSDEWK